MERVVHVLVAVAMVNAAGLPQDNLKTLDEFFLEQYNLHIHEFSSRELADLRNDSECQTNTDYESFPWKATPLTLTKEVLDYTKVLEESIMSELSTVLENVTVQSIYEDLNYHCSEYFEAPIDDLRIEPRNVTCVTIQLMKTLTLKLKTAIEIGLQQLSHQCVQKQFDFCLAVNASCTLAHEQRVGQLLSSFIEDANDLGREDGATPLEIIKDTVVKNTIHIFRILTSVYKLVKCNAYFTSSVRLSEPFAIENLLQPWTGKAITSIFVRTNNTIIKSQDTLTWGIVRSNTATVELPCHNYRDFYSKKSEQFLTFLNRCSNLNMLESIIDLMRCAYKDPTSRPLTWATSPSVYFHSQCLCLVSNNDECGVKVPESVDPRFYCLSVLLRDLQRQVSYRPAATYLDYAFQTRVPVCKFSKLMQIAFRSDCDDTATKSSFDFVVSVQCYFKDLVNKDLNCSETLLMNSLNHTVLCGAKYFLEFVLCDGDDVIRVPYYGAGDSTLLLVLTYVDVAVRVLTLVTYLACPQLRNFPGKLLIGYQVTALLRLVVVRACLADLALAVRLDVAMDMASTLWLTAYLHFLTWCLMSVRYSLPQRLTLALRVLHSQRPDETRVVLLCYMLFGWALPAALSTAFFWMDEVMDSRVQFGQLLFVLCNYVAIFANVFMFYKNCHFYYVVKNCARLVQQGDSTRSVFPALFKFAVKTALLSGVGITFRLLFTQIQGLEDLLGYYHALGTLQGLLLFALYGCNHEARDFWMRVVSSAFHHCHRRQNTST